MDILTLFIVLAVISVISVAVRKQLRIWARRIGVI